MRTGLNLLVESSRKREIEGEVGGDEREKGDEGDERLHADGSDLWMID